MSGRVCIAVVGFGSMVGPAVQCAFTVAMDDDGAIDELAHAGCTRAMVSVTSFQSI